MKQAVCGLAHSAASALRGSTTVWRSIVVKTPTPHPHQTSSPAPTPAQKQACRTQLSSPKFLADHRRRPGEDCRNGLNASHRRKPIAGDSSEQIKNAETFGKCRCRGFPERALGPQRDKQNIGMLVSTSTAAASIKLGQSIRLCSIPVPR